MRKCIMILLLLPWIGPACEEEPTVPPELQAELNTPVSTPNRPTTQQLLEGPRVHIPLDPLPFSVKAPKGWKVDSLAGVMFLQGPTPSGEVQIRLSTRPPMKKEHFEPFITGAKKELAEKPDSIIKSELRDLGEAKVFEKQSLGQEVPAAPIGIEGHMSPAFTPLSWTFTIFVPKGDMYGVSELNFVGLTKDQYEADKKLLDEVIGSLTHQLAAPVPGAV